MSTPLLTIRNNHALASGDPPIVSNSPDAYIGYFENMYGEQWVFTYDRDTGAATLHGGDVGWNTRIEVCDGRVEGLVLQEDEAAWLRVCWNTAIARYGT